MSTTTCERRGSTQVHGDGWQHARTASRERHVGREQVYLPTFWAVVRDCPFGRPLGTSRISSAPSARLSHEQGDYARLGISLLLRRHVARALAGDAESDTVAGCLCLRCRRSASSRNTALPCWPQPRIPQAPHATRHTRHQTPVL